MSFRLWVRPMVTLRYVPCMQSPLMFFFCSTYYTGDLNTRGRTWMTLQASSFADSSTTALLNFDQREILLKRRQWNGLKLCSLLRYMPILFSVSF